MDAQELVKGLSEESLNEIVDAAAAEARERGLSIAALETVGNLAVGGAAREADTGDAADETSTEAKEAFVDTRESILSQVPKTWRAYGEVKDLVGKYKDRASREVFEAELQAWLSDDKVDYIAKAEEADPELKFTLVATPNELVTLKQLVQLAKLFGEEQPYPTYVYEQLYSQYTKEQLSGTDPSNGQAIVFSLISSKLSPELTGTVATQKANLEQLQSSELKTLKVPSLLEAVAYWYTLRANGNKLNAPDTFNLTYIRHFNLPEMRFKDWWLVPDSCTHNEGRPALDVSAADSDYRSRVVVG